MIKGTLMLIGCLVLVVGTSGMAQGDERPTYEPLATEHDCRNTCSDCQHNCQSQPAGTKQTDCMKACTSGAAACCSVLGKKPPQGLSCACM